MMIWLDIGAFLMALTACHPSFAREFIDWRGEVRRAGWSDRAAYHIAIVAFAIVIATWPILLGYLTKGVINSLKRK